MTKRATRWLTVVFAMIALIAVIYTMAYEATGMFVDAVKQLTGR